MTLSIVGPTFGIVDGIVSAQPGPLGIGPESPANILPIFTARLSQDGTSASGQEHNQQDE